MTTAKSRRVRPPRFKVFQRTETELTHASIRHRQRQRKGRLPQRHRMRALSRTRRTRLWLLPTYQKAKPQALLLLHLLLLLLQPPRLYRLGIMTMIEVVKAVVHEDQDNEEVLVLPVEGSIQGSLGIDVRTVVRDAIATGLMDLRLDARDVKDMMADLGVAVVRLPEVTEETIVGKAIDRVVVGVVEEVHRWKAIEENPSVIGPAAGVRIEGSRIVIDLAVVVVQVKIEENPSVIDPVVEVEGKIEGAIQEAGVTIDDRNLRYAICEPLEVESVNLDAYRILNANL
jgi:hypothetical protein